MALFHRPRRQTQIRQAWPRALSPTDRVHSDPSLHTAAELVARPEQPPGLSTRPAASPKGPVAA